MIYPMTGPSLLLTFENGDVKSEPFRSLDHVTVKKAKGVALNLSFCNEEAIISLDVPRKLLECDVQLQGLYVCGQDIPKISQLIQTILNQHQNINFIDFTLAKNIVDEVFFKLFSVESPSASCARSLVYCNLTNYKGGLSFQGVHQWLLEHPRYKIINYSYFLEEMRSIAIEACGRKAEPTELEVKYQNYANRYDPALEPKESNSGDKQQYSLESLRVRLDLERCVDKRIRLKFDEAVYRVHDKHMFSVVELDVQILKKSAVIGLPIANQLASLIARHNIFNFENINYAVTCEKRLIAFINSDTWCELPIVLKLIILNSIVTAYNGFPFHINITRFREVIDFLEVHENQCIRKLNISQDLLENSSKGEVFSSEMVNNNRLSNHLLANWIELWRRSVWMTEEVVSRKIEVCCSTPVPQKIVELFVLPKSFLQEPNKYFLTKMKRKPTAEELVCVASFFKVLLEGLNNIHKQGYIHCDMEFQRLDRGDGLELILVDSGIVLQRSEDRRLLLESQDISSEDSGLIAPEYAKLLQDGTWEKVTEKINVWWLGVALSQVFDMDFSNHPVRNIVSGVYRVKSKFLKKLQDRGFDISNVRHLDVVALLESQDGRSELLSHLINQSVLGEQECKNLLAEFELLAICRLDFLLNFKEGFSEIDVDVNAIFSKHLGEKDFPTESMIGIREDLIRNEPAASKKIDEILNRMRLIALDRYEKLPSKMMMARELARFGEDEESLFKEDLKQYYSEKDCSLGSVLASLVQNCFELDPDKRPSVEAIIGAWASVMKELSTQE